VIGRLGLAAGVREDEDRKPDGGEDGDCDFLAA
jgi:hypothetical protein